MLIEMLFDNLLDDLSPPELAAVLSILVYEMEDKDLVIRNKKLKELSEKMKVIAERLCQLEIQCGLEIDLETVVKERTRCGFMEIAYNWCKGMSFADIMKTTQLNEGYVVNTLIRTEGVCRRLGSIAYEIGNPDLRFKCEEISQAMMRDIVFTPSLYLQDSYNCLYQQTNSDHNKNNLTGRDLHKVQYTTLNGGHRKIDLASMLRFRRSSSLYRLCSLR